MRKIVLLIVLMLGVGTLSAQKRKAKPEVVLPQVTVEEALAAYDFNLAEQIINMQITDLTKKKQSTVLQEEQLIRVHQAQQKLNAVERVVFVDSLVLPRKQLLSHLCLSSESGSIVPASEILNINDSMDCMAYRSQMGDKVYFPQPDNQGFLRLMSCDIIAGVATPAQPQVGLYDDEPCHVNYPYMMSDGTTLYFAAQCDEGLGGYDIYMSRYDADERRFLAPENVGMPFNSPANDYLMCIDEFYNIGCFVTDRNQPSDSVCVYYFIPSETRHVYIAEEVGDVALRSLAKLNSIRDTWTSELAVRAAKSRLQECFSHKPVVTVHDFVFALTDSRTCYSLSDFSSTKAQMLVQQWVEMTKQKQKIAQQLTELRSQYRNNKQNASQILELEQTQENLSAELKQIAKAIRRAETGL